MSTDCGGGSGQDLVGGAIVDYETRVDVARLKRERLARLRREMRVADLAAVLLYDPVNIRYATGSRDGSAGFGLRFYHRYALVPHDGRVILFGSLPELAGEETGIEVRTARTWDFFPCGSHVEEAALRWAAEVTAVLDEWGVRGERVGIDRLDFVGFDAL